MEINLDTKVVIVTGGGRGIGRTIVETLADEGAWVVTTDVNSSALQDVAEVLEARGATHREYECDVTDSEQVQSLIANVVEAYGRVDVLVNNAGVALEKPIAAMSESEWETIHDVNLKGTFLTSQAVLPIMKKQRSGRIINAASFAALVPIYGSAAYASSKAAVAHFTRALAGEVGPWNITANAYAPGMVPTKMNGFKEREPEEQAKLLDTLSLRRWGEAEEVAHLICFLSSRYAAYITGTLIDISGGKLGNQIPRLAYEAAALTGEYDF